MKKCPICKAEVKELRYHTGETVYKCTNAFCGETYIESENKIPNFKINFKGGRKL